MKRIFIILACMQFFVACTKLDLNPLSEGSSENWYSDEKEITLSLNDLYRDYLWELETNLTTERLTDNWTQRQAVSDFPAGAITSKWATAESVWSNAYKGITRANTILEKLEKATGQVSAEKLHQLAGEAYFMRAVFYARLIFYYGDVPFYTHYLTIDQAFAQGRTDKKTILENVYKDFDLAIEYLPVSYANTELQKATKGAALAFKARTALYMSDWAIARDASQQCIGLKQYSLYPDFGEYFHSSTRNVKETIFAIPHSAELGSTWATTNFFTRTAGGSAVAQPSWELFCSFPCTDGLPIDQSPLYDPHNPFKNRDPRCAMTIVEFGTPNLGFIYDPNPYTTKVQHVGTGTMVSNKDSRTVDQYAAYNGLSLKKWVDADWADDLKSDFDNIIMRYADVLLMYAEATIELKAIDASTLDAINQVRARAYKVDVAATNQYPAVTETNQGKLRQILRNERRIELAWENRRFDDLIRWKLAEKALTRPIYGMLDPSDLKAKVVDKGLWFFPGTPDIDEDGLPNFSSMYNTGLIKLLVERHFDKSKQYLWPIPSEEILINKNMKQNDGY